MARQVIALFDPDAEYALKVAEAARRSNGGGQIEIVAFSSPAVLTEYLIAEHPCLLAVNIQWKEEVKAAVAGVRVVWLTEEKSGESSGDRVLFKYQPVSHLIEELIREGELQQSSRERSRVSSSCANRGAVVIAIWSAAGGVGKSTVAALLSNEMNKQTGGIFCLSLETGMTSGLWLEGAGLHDAGGWLYEFKSGRRIPVLEEGAEQAEQAVWDGVESFRQDVPIREFAKLTKADTQQLIRRAASLDGCRSVIIDCESGWSESSEAAWEESDLIVCLCGHDRASRIKTERWLSEWPEWQQGGMLQRKTLFAVNKALPAEQPVPHQFSSRGFSPLPYIPEWKQAVELDLSRHSSFRQAILHMAVRIREAVSL